MEQEDGSSQQKENHANPVGEPKQQGFTQPQPLPTTPMKQEDGPPQQNPTENGGDSEPGQGRTTTAFEAETGAIPRALPSKSITVAPKDGNDGNKPGNHSKAGEDQKGEWSVSTSSNDWFFLFNGKDNFCVHPPLLYMAGCCSP